MTCAPARQTHRAPTGTSTPGLRLVGAVLLCLSSIGCDWAWSSDVPIISNRTGATIEIHWDQPASNGSFSTTLASGADYPLLDTPLVCKPVHMVATDLQGREIARLTKPLCPRDTWVIGGSPEPSS